MHYRKFKAVDICHHTGCAAADIVGLFKPQPDLFGILLGQSVQTAINGGIAAVHIAV